VQLVLDSNDRLAGFGITMPSLSKALQKTKGKLLPFGIFHLLKAIRKNNVADLMLVAIRPDLQITQLRGNLDTRMRKLDEGQFDAIILAAAGIKRLGLHNRITEILPFEVSLPAIGQGP
jgi:hypothetical protein